MNARNTLCVGLILITSCQTYGMKRNAATPPMGSTEAPRKRAITNIYKKSSPSTSLSSSPDPLIASPSTDTSSPALSQSSEQIPMELITEPLDDSIARFTEGVEIEIHRDSDPLILGTQLALPQARLIRNQKRNQLYKMAEDYSDLLDHSDKAVLIKLNYLDAFRYIPQFTFPQAFFTPVPYNNRTNDDRPELHKILETLIKNEKEKIYVCCYHFTLTSLAQALVAQKNKGISIEFITNQPQKNKPNEQFVLTNMQENGISILSPQNDKFEQMHHKFFIFNKNLLDKRLLVIGSYNPTTHGNDRSWDDIMILDDPIIIDQYLARFEELKKRSK